MKQYLKISLPAFVALVLAIFFLYHSKSSTAQASTGVDVAAPLLSQIADSLRTVSLKLDATIGALVSESNDLASRIRIPVTSTELKAVSDSLAEFVLPELNTITPHTDAFELNARILWQYDIAAALEGRIQEYQSMLDRLPTLVPCHGEETSGFGGRIHPIFGMQKMHTGIDLGAPTGTPIYAAGGGTVIFAGWKSGYGKVVEIDHGYGYHTLYGHSSKLLVNVGDVIRRGDTIALVGSTGNSTGSHLHYETIVSQQKINPEPFMMASRVRTDTAVATTIARR